MWPPRSSDLTSRGKLLWVGTKMKSKEQNQGLERKLNGTNAAVPLDFLKSVSRILGPVLQVVTKRWLWTLKVCPINNNVSFILGNTNI